MQEERNEAERRRVTAEEWREGRKWKKKYGGRERS